MKVVSLITAAVLAGAGLGLAATPAGAAVRCEGGTHSGRCITVSKPVRHLQVVEEVDLVNRSHKTVTMGCVFTRTVTKTTETSQTLTGEVKVEVFKVVDLSVSYGVTWKVSQSAAAATSASASVRLKPGQRVTCQRTYGYVKANVKQYDWGPQHSTRYYTVKVPINLGMRIVD